MITTPHPQPLSQVRGGRLTRTTAFSILEIDSQIEWLISLPPDPLKGELEKEIENLKQQKIQLYEDSCNRF